MAILGRKTAFNPLLSSRSGCPPREPVMAEHKARLRLGQGLSPDQSQHPQPIGGHYVNLRPQCLARLRRWLAELWRALRTGRRAVTGFISKSRCVSGSATGRWAKRDRL